MTHKTISLLQPWATLVVLGLKTIETRSFQRAYRGPLLIHASGKWNKDLALMISRIGAYDLLCDAGYDWNPAYPKRTNLPLGAIIGSVNLRAIIPSEHSYGAESIEWASRRWHFTEEEKTFGDFGENRYLWMLSDAVAFDEPIPAKGMLCVFNWEGEIPNQNENQQAQPGLFR